MRRFIPHYPDMVLRVTGAVGFLVTWTALAFTIALVLSTI